MHRNAPLTPEGRLRLCQRIEAGWPVAQAAASMGISRDRAYVWWRRYQADGRAGLEDRSSRPHRSPHQTRPSRERRIISLRRDRGLGPARIAGIVGMPASTVHRVLSRHGLNRLDHLDRVTRAPIRRIVMSRPGELVHVDIKKLGRIPRGGGWRVHGRTARPNSRRARNARLGYAYVHSAIDGYSRLQRSARKRTRPNRRRVHDPRTCVLHRPRHRRRTRPERQRCLLPKRRIRGRSRRHRAHLHPALQASNQRQNRALQPNPAGRVGVRPTLDLRRSTNPRPCPMASHLQPSPTPHRHRRPTHNNVGNLPGQYT